MSDAARQPSEYEVLIATLANTRDAVAVERIADSVRRDSGANVAAALLKRLGDALVQEDRDAEDAVCDALVRLGLMRRLGNLRFVFADSMGDQPLERYGIRTPRKYLTGSCA